MIADANFEGFSDKLTMIEFTEVISDYMKAADVFVHPSVREGLPNALLEAMASSLPCIVSRLPGVTDSLIKNGLTGFLIEKDDLESLKVLLKLLITDPALGQQLGKNARELVMASYSPLMACHATLRLYRTGFGR
jgi:glycosyltransferase involved in cell wall biosynthesis